MTHPVLLAILEEERADGALAGLYGSRLDRAITALNRCFRAGQAEPRVVVRGMSDCLGFAESLNRGEPMRIYSANEFTFQDVRLDPGTYELRKVSDASSDRS